MKKVILSVIISFMLVTAAGACEPVPTPNQTQNQNQQQQQIQSQQQSQVVNVGGESSSNMQRDLLAAPIIYPINNFPMQNGKVGDITASMPKFASSALVPLERKDVIVKVLDVYFGNMWSRVTYDELESYILEKAQKYEGMTKVRYSVKFMDRVKSGGMGGGVAGSSTGNDGLTSATGSILPGANWSMASPVHIITFYEVR